MTVAASFSFLVMTNKLSQGLLGHLPGFFFLSFFFKCWERHWKQSQKKFTENTQEATAGRAVAKPTIDDKVGASLCYAISIAATASVAAGHMRK